MPGSLLLALIAAVVAEEVLGRHPGVRSTRVIVNKPHVAVPGVLSHCGVEICRQRPEQAQPV